MVGYGEIYPVSPIEQMMATFVMMFGVSLFSYIMG